MIEIYERKNRKTVIRSKTSVQKTYYENIFKVSHISKKNYYENVKPAIHLFPPQGFFREIHHQF